MGNRIVSTSIITILSLAISACCTKPWKKFPNLPAPDTAFRTGAVHGYDVYIWKCLKGKRIVIHAYSAEMSCKEPVQITGPCGKKTDFEKQLKYNQHLPVPAVMRWPQQK